MIVKKRRLIFPVMVIFLILYILATPERLTDKILFFRNQGPKFLPVVEEKDIEVTKSKGDEYVEGELIVKFVSSVRVVNSKTGIAQLDLISDKYQVESIKKIKLSGSDQVYKIKIADDSNLKKVVDEYLKTSYVEWVEPHFKARMTATHPNDPKYQDGTQWALNKIQAAAGWDYETGSSDVVIAIIDSGVDTDHPDLADNLWTNPGEMGGGKESNGIDDDDNGYVDDWRGWDWVNNDNDPNPTPDGINNDGLYGIDDGVTHGSHVAGIAAAVTNNNTGIAGVCWSCKIMALRVLDDEGWGTYEDVVAAIEYATNMGADVINMSLAGGYSNLVNDAIKYAFINDVVIVAAAGNEATNIGINKRSPVCNDGNQNMVIGVAATSSTDKLAGYSNYAMYYVDISAPGNSIYSTLYTNDPEYGFTQDYGYMSGTSMAAPHVAGLAGLVKSANPTWSGPEIRDRVINLSNNVDSLNPSYYQRMGSGRMNLEKSLNSSNGFYPSGTVVKVAGSNQSIWLISNGQKRVIPSRVFRTFYFDDIYDIVYVSLEELKKYPRGPHARFPDGILVGARRSGRVYVLDERYLRKISSWSLFDSLGYSRESIRWSNFEYINYPVGTNMTVGRHGSGTVVTADGNNYFRLNAGFKDQIEAPLAFLRYYTQSRPVVNISSDELVSYDDGSTIRFPDGILLGDRNTSNIYYTEYGKKRQFDNLAELTSMKYRESKIRWRWNEADHYLGGQLMGFE